MVEKIQKLIGKVYKGRGQYANATFFDIDEIMQSKFINTLILWIVFIFISLVLTIVTFNPYLVLFGLLFGVTGIAVVSIKIDNYLNGKVIKVEGEYYDSNLPTAKNVVTKKLEKEKDFFTDKNFYIRILTKDEQLIRLPVPRSFKAKKGNQITAYVTENRAYIDDDETYIIQDCYYVYVSKVKS